LGGVPVFRNGEPIDFDLSQAESVLKSEEVVIEVSLGAGAATWTAWTCDFSYDYVKINAEYHT
jgi:glutamate N-acetyltransferase/amino-acid N-acetyltransferase